MRYRAPATDASAPIPGPATEPADSIPMTMPDSRPRRPGGALSVTQDIDAVQIDPLAAPCRKRASVRMIAVGAQANTTVAAVISIAESTVILRAPTRGTQTMQASETKGTEIG